MLWVLCVVLCVVFIFMRVLRGVTKSSTCLVGKTALVTGANSGIGYQTALNLASRGCRVIMADVEDMELSKRNIITYTDNPNIIIKKLDLASLKSVRDFASEIIKTEPKLDILINNAGISASAANRTKDGLHPVMQINYFGHFLLTHLLLDLLKQSAPGRIVFTSSFMSFYSNLTLDNLNYNDSWNNILSKARIYCNSKYALLIASDIFAKKLQGTGVTSNSVNPGFCATTMLSKFFRQIPYAILLDFIIYPYMWAFCKSAWEGAQVLVHVAVSKKLEGVTGNHYWDCKAFFKPLGAYNKNFCQKIWTASENYVQLAPNERL